MAELSGFQLLQYALRQAEGSEELRQALQAAARQYYIERRKGRAGKWAVGLSGVRAPAVEAAVRQKQEGPRLRKQAAIQKQLEELRAYVKEIDKFDAELAKHVADKNIDGYNKTLARKDQMVASIHGTREGARSTSAQLRQRSLAQRFTENSADTRQLRDLYAPALDVGTQAGLATDFNKVQNMAKVVKAGLNNDEIRSNLAKGVEQSTRDYVTPLALDYASKSGAKTYEEFRLYHGATKEQLSSDGQENVNVLLAGTNEGKLLTAVENYYDQFGPAGAQSTLKTSLDEINVELASTTGSVSNPVIADLLKRKEAIEAQMVENEEAAETLGASEHKTLLSGIALIKGSGLSPGSIDKAVTATQNYMNAEYGLASEDGGEAFMKQYAKVTEKGYEDIELTDADQVKEQLAALEEDYRRAGMAQSELMVEDALGAGTEAAQFAQQGLSQEGVTAGETTETVSTFVRGLDPKATRPKATKRGAKKAGRKDLPEEFTLPEPQKTAAISRQGEDMATGTELVAAEEDIDKALAPKRAVAEATKVPKPPSDADAYIAGQSSVAGGPYRAGATQEVQQRLGLLDRLPSVQREKEDEQAALARAMGTRNV